MFSHILIPVDGSERSEEAARQGVQLAKALGARVTALHVTPASQAFPSVAGTAFNEAMAAGGQATLRFVQKVAHAAGVACAPVLVSADDPYKEIIAAAERNGCDLVVMASHGRHGIEGVLLGSETHKVLVHSRIPVLVVR